MSASDSLADVECYHAIVFYAKLKVGGDILHYINNFTDARILFDKRSVGKLFISDVDTRKKRKTAGETNT